MAALADKPFLNWLYGSPSSAAAAFRESYPAIKTDTWQPQDYHTALGKDGVIQLILAYQQATRPATPAVVSLYKTVKGSAWRRGWRFVGRWLWKLVMLVWATLQVIGFATRVFFTGLATVVLLVVSIFRLMCPIVEEYDDKPKLDTIDAVQEEGEQTGTVNEPAPA